jgi:RNA polymerase sigma-70 factor, ECF subfamily
MMWSPTMSPESSQMGGQPLPDDVPAGQPSNFPLDPESSFVLIQRARRGDDAALNRLLERYTKRLRIWAHGRLPAQARGPADTMDVVQDTLFIVVKRLDTFELRHEGAFLGFVRATLHNDIVDRIRRAQRRGPSEPTDSSTPSRDPSPEQEAIAAQLTDRYEAALARLNADQREAIVTRVEFRLSWQETAAALKKPSVGAAQMAVRRALVRLAQEMSYEPRS